MYTFDEIPLSSIRQLTVNASELNSFQVECSITEILYVIVCFQSWGGDFF